MPTLMHLRGNEIISQSAAAMGSRGCDATGIGFPESLDSHRSAPRDARRRFLSLSLSFPFRFSRRRVISLSLFGSPKWPHAASVASSWYKYIWELGRCPEPRPSRTVYDPSSSLIPFPGNVVYESGVRVFPLFLPRNSLMTIPIFPKMLLQLLWSTKDSITIALKY